MHEDSFEDYVHASGARLKRLAFLLTGDLHQAEDLLQSAYAKAMPHWRKVKGYDVPDAYMRRVMVSIRTSWWRRSRGRELTVPEIPEQGSGTTTVDDGVIDNHVLLAALRALPDRQRAAVVLRHWCDLSEAERPPRPWAAASAPSSPPPAEAASLRAALDDRSDARQKGN